MSKSISSNNSELLFSVENKSYDPKYRNSVRIFDSWQKARDYAIEYFGREDRRHKIVVAVGRLNEINPWTVLWHPGWWKEFGYTDDMWEVVHEKFLYYINNTTGKKQNQPNNELLGVFNEITASISIDSWYTHLK